MLKYYLYVFTRVRNNQVEEMEVFQLPEEAEAKLQREIKIEKANNTSNAEVTLYYEDGDWEAHFKVKNDCSSYYNCELKITEQEVFLS